MAVPNIFGTATAAIPLSQLDQNFATAITLGNTAVYLGNTTTSLGNVTLTNVTISSGNVTLTGANVSGTANVSTLVVTGNAVVSVTDNTNAALRITQLGTGNALLVEDSTNPDATPFVIDASGNVYSGYLTPFNYLSIGGGTLNPRVSVAGTTGDLGSIGAAVFANATTAPTVVGAKSRDTTVGSHTVVQSGDSLLNILAEGSDGTAFIRAASIVAAVDGTPGTNDMPGRLVFSTTADGASTVTERMRIDSSGNVGIGTSSVGSKLHVVSSSGENKIISEATAASQQASLSLIVQAATPGQTVIYMGKTGATTNGQLGYDPNINAMTMYTNNSERMRINSSGFVGINNTNPSWLLTASNTGTSPRIAVEQTADVSADMITFRRNGSERGKINITDSATQYQTSSDYRLKENITALTNGLETVAKLKPSSFTWVQERGGQQDTGFIAHELAEVCPNAVTGEKDAVDADGKPMHQGIDTSFLVATLTAAIQEQQALITALTARITALEQA
jgi:hypothetical protein